MNQVVLLAGISTLMFGAGWATSLFFSRQQRQNLLSIAKDEAERIVREQRKMLSHAEDRVEQMLTEAKADAENERHAAQRAGEQLQNEMRQAVEDELREFKLRSKEKQSARNRSIDSRLEAVADRERSVAEREISCVKHAQALEERERNLHLEQLRMKRDLPHSPYPDVSTEQLIANIKANWRSADTLINLGLELSFRRHRRVVEHLEQINSRLKELGSTRSFRTIHADLDASSDYATHRAQINKLLDRIRILEETCTELRDGRRTEARNDRVDELRRERNELREENSRLESALARARREFQTSPEHITDLLDQISELRSQNMALAQRARSLEWELKNNSGRDNGGPLREYFVDNGAPKDFLMHVHKYWRKKLHPDGKPGRMEDLTAQFQLMEQSFSAAMAKAS